MRKSFIEYCRQYGREDLINEWHPTKNPEYDPQKLSYGSHTKVWWKCAHGHEWESRIYSRTGQQRGCPYCAGKAVAPGADLKALYPEIAAQWHPRKNADHGPEQYLPQSHVSVWWICEEGHEWRATIKSRVEGCGCPVCANRSVLVGKNDLASCYPGLAAQWHPDKNGELKPTQLIAKSSRRVWWRCERGHEWQAAVYSRTEGSDCPVCCGKVIIPGVNDLETFDPKIAAQWCREKNGTLSPQQVSPYSNANVWWQCELGHVWKGRIASRTFAQSGCPYCSNKKVLAGFNDLATAEPKVAAQWHPSLNEPLEPTMVTVGSRKKVWWRCALGHEWKAVVYSRAGVQKCGCPVCAGKRKEYG